MYINFRSKIQKHIILTTLTDVNRSINAGYVKPNVMFDMQQYACHMKPWHAVISEIDVTFESLLFNCFAKRKEANIDNRHVVIIISEYTFICEMTSLIAVSLCDARRVRSIPHWERKVIFTLEGSTEFIVKFFVLLRNSFLMEMFIGLEANDSETNESQGALERNVLVKILPFS